MTRVATLLILAGAVPLASCQAPARVAAQRCRAEFAVGSDAYAVCLNRAYQAEINAMNQQLNETARDQFHTGY